MSNNDSGRVPNTENHASINRIQRPEETSLPPRHTKHGMSEERGTSFPYSQLLLGFLIILIIAGAAFWFVQNKDLNLFANPSTKASPETIHIVKKGKEGQQPKNDTSEVEKSSTTVSTDENEETSTKEQTSEEQGTTQEAENDPSHAQQDSNDGQGTEQDTEQANQDGQGVEDSSTQPSIIAVHTVQSGDTLYSITMHYYKTKKYEQYLADFNHIVDPTKDIKIGMKLKIPEKP